MILEGVRAKTEDQILRQLIDWATKLSAEEKARPLHNAIAALHSQIKSQVRPAQIHIWTD